MANPINLEEKEILVLNKLFKENFRGISGNESPSYHQTLVQESLNTVPKHFKKDLIEDPDIFMSGSFGVVVKVFSSIIGPAALKKLRTRFLTGIQRDQWKREFDSIYYLNHHPNIVTLYGYVYESETNPNPCGILMEYMIGGNLEDFILKDVAHGKYSITDDIKNTWAKQIALGLNFIHSRNIMHRDLKPDNILLCQNRFTAKIADFGLARRLEISEEAKGGYTKAIGNPMYTAPEIYMEKGVYTRTADVWSYAMLLYFIYYQKNPYDPLSFKKISQYTRVNVWTGKQQHDIMPMRPPLNGYAIDSVIKKCWQTEPADRGTMSYVVNYFYNTNGVEQFPSLSV